MDKNYIDPGPGRAFTSNACPLPASFRSQISALDWLLFRAVYLHKSNHCISSDFLLQVFWTPSGGLFQFSPFSDSSAALGYLSLSSRVLVVAFVLFYPVSLISLQS